MLYLGNASSPGVRAAMLAGELGQMCTPAERKLPLPGVTWAADNGCFGKGYPGDDAWLAWLVRHQPAAPRCLFATAPDVVGDAVATLHRSLPWLPRVRALGYPAALVAQDGLEELPVPWAALDVLFLGGTTDWKVSDAARSLATEALARGKRVHMGRVNGGRRYRLAHAWGCHSVDGTLLAFGPEKNMTKLRTWMEACA